MEGGQDDKRIEMDYVPNLHEECHHYVLQTCANKTLQTKSHVWKTYRKNNSVVKVIGFPLKLRTGQG